jgi:origin recognition complex subunit 3
MASSLVRSLQSILRLYGIHLLSEGTLFVLLPNCVAEINRVVERFLEDADWAEISAKLLDSDRDLMNVVIQEVRNSQILLSRMTSACQVLERSRNEMPGMAPLPLSQIYLHAIKGGLLESPIFREFLLILKKSPSDLLTKLLDTLAPFFSGDRKAQLDSLLTELQQILRSAKYADPIKSTHDLRNITMRTTVIAQKVELSTQAANISEDEKNYSAVLDRFCEWFETYMKESIVSVSDVIFSEILVYDKIYADGAVFLPKARFSIERALSAPHDYLGCDCCKKAEEVCFVVCYTMM